MRIKRINVITNYLREEINTFADTYTFRDDCRIEREKHRDAVIVHHYRPDGNKNEEITTFDNGDYYKVRYDYDDEGGLMGTVTTNKYGEVIAKSYYDWIKPQRVVSIETQLFRGNDIVRGFETKYYRKDGQIRFERGLERFTKYDYDDNGHLVQITDSYCIEVEEELVWLSEVRVFNEDGLLIRDTDEIGRTGTFEYEYDDNGNWIRMKGRIDSGSVSVVSIREIEYASGEGICTSMFDCDNLLMYR